MNDAIVNRPANGKCNGCPFRTTENYPSRIMLDAYRPICTHGGGRVRLPMSNETPDWCPLPATEED